MPTTPQTYVIIGASLAGAKAAETLRAEGFGGQVLLIGEEPRRPYERPPLSKAYLAGSAELDSTELHKPAWYFEHDVELELGIRATALDASAQTVTLGADRIVRYDKLLLATGASPRRLDIPGSQLEGVHYLRTAADADLLRQALTGGARRVVVVGGGWIGLEAAAAARAYGNDVTILEQSPTPLHTVLGSSLGEVFARLHRDHGVDLRVRTGVRGFRGVGSRITAVVTDLGDELPADVVVVGIGAVPNTDLAEAAGLHVDNGVVVDAALRTRDPSVFAAGDVANPFHPSLDRHLRVEHWANALHGGPAAARSMLGHPVSYDPVPYFFTDQYDLGMEYSGHAGPGDYDQMVVRGDLDSLEFVAFWLAGDRVVAGMNVNIWDVNDPIQRLIRSRRIVDPAELADPDQSLDQLTDPSDEKDMR